MIKKSPLNTLLYYAADDGMDQLYTDFKKGLNAFQKDPSKEYCEKEKIIYYYPGIYDEQNTHMGFNFEAESEPYSFENHVKEKINRHSNEYLSWLEDLFEQESAEKTLAIISDHKSKIQKLHDKIDSEDSYPRAALRVVLKKLNEKEGYYIKGSDNSISVINEFVETFSKKTTYPKKVIKTYLESWVNNQGRSYPRAIAKDSIRNMLPKMPADGTLGNWEEKWIEFKEARTKN